MKKTTHVKKIANALKRLTQPTTALEPEQLDLSVAIMKLVERFDALERKTDLVAGQLSALSMEVRNVIQQTPRSTVSPAVSATPQVTGPIQRVSRGRHDRLLHQAVCADCRSNCEVPIKPTQGRPVYCKPCYALRKAAKGGKPNIAPKSATGNSIPKSEEAVPDALREISPKAATGVPLKGNAVDPSRSNSFVLKQNLARQNAVAYMAKKAGHLPNSQKPGVEAPPSGAPLGRLPAAKSIRPPRSSPHDRSKPQKRR